MSIQAHDTAFVRTPAYSLTEYDRLVTSDSYLADLLTHDVFFRNGLFLASPDLFETVTKSTNLPETLRQNKKLRLSLLKYAIRAMYRSTPFGTFAGITTAKLSQETAIEIMPRETFSVHARIDVDYICTLIKEISSHPAIRKYLIYYPNSTLYRLGENYRYIEIKHIGNRRKHALSSIEYNPYIEQVLAGAKQGATIAQLASTIVSEDITEEEAQYFIDEIIDSQVLVNELEPSTLGAEIPDQLIQNLLRVVDRPMEAEHRHLLQYPLQQLQQYTNTLKSFSGISPINNLVDHYMAAISQMKKLLPDTMDKLAIQTDMRVKLSKNQIDRKILRDIHTGIDIMKRFAGNAKEKRLLDVFIESFIARYETREIPLVEALDVESGIGYGDYLSNTQVESTEILRGLPFNSNQHNIETLKLNYFSDFFARKILHCFRTNTYVVQLQDEELKEFKAQPDQYFCDTFSVGSSLFTNKITGERAIELKFCGGVSGTIWTGRFCHIDPDINQLTADLIHYEEKAGNHAIVAEINHLPHDRLGNVLQRPTMRKYEIPYMAKGSVDKDHQLSIEDLYISVVDGKIRLRSKSLDKEIIPALSNAHSYQFNSLPLYYFLADLQQRDRDLAYTFDWNTCLKMFKFTPRVMYKEIILSPACWRLDKQDIDTVTLSAQPLGAFRELCRQLMVPRYFLMSEGDHQLLMDTDSDFCLELLLQEIKGKGAVIIHESLINDYNFVSVNSDGEQYSHEILFSFRQENTPETKPYVADNHPAGQRLYIPGSDWLYYKIYGGYKVNDDLITQLQAPLKELVSKGIIDKWFFLRYYDPSPHLRLRLHFHDKRHIAAGMEVMTAFLDPFCQEGLIWKIMLDTYQPEVERYGHGGMEEVETLFHVDSENCLELLSFIKETGNEELRWLSAVYNIDNYMNLSGLNREQKKELVKAAIASYGKQLGSMKITQKNIAGKYQQHKDMIHELLTGNTSQEPLSTLLQLLDRHTNRIAPLLTIIKNRSGRHYSPLLTDFIHMNIDRMARSKNLKFEYVTYELLENFYFRTKQTLIPKQV